MSHSLAQLILGKDNCIDPYGTFLSSELWSLRRRFSCGHELVGFSEERVILNLRSRSANYGGPACLSTASLFFSELCDNGACLQLARQISEVQLAVLRTHVGNCSAAKFLPSARGVRGRKVKPGRPSVRKLSYGLSAAGVPFFPCREVVNLVIVAMRVREAIAFYLDLHLQCGKRDI